MLFFILLFISVLFMGVALFSIVLHFSRKKESVFHDSDDDVFVLQKDQPNKESGALPEDSDSDEKHDILNSDTKERQNQKHMNQIFQNMKSLFSKVHIFVNSFLSKSKSVISNTSLRMSSLLSKFHQVVKDRISAFQSRDNIDSSDGVGQEEAQDLQTPSDEDFRSLYVESKFEVDEQKELSKPLKNNSVTEEDQMPKRVPEKELNSFLLDTEDDIAELEVSSRPEVVVEENSVKTESIEPEPQKKADSFVKGLMNEEGFHGIDQSGSEDAISDNYYYTYMEKRYIKKIVSNPKDVEVYRKLGDLYIEMENFADAQASFEQVLRLKPADKHAILALKELEDHI